MKRVFDFGMALLGIFVLFPIFLFIAAAVKIGDGGPIFYRQERVGRKGRHFRIWKFRTMSVGADKVGPSITKRGDLRVTRVGRILRSTKLDELPQLLNVLVGEMSFVGPRPEVPRYVAVYTDEQRKVLELIPGITDLASLEFRDEESLLAAAPDSERFYREYCIPKKIELNLAYAAKSSVLSDIRLIMNTVSAIASDRRGSKTRKHSTPS